MILKQRPVALLVPGIVGFRTVVIEQRLPGAYLDLEMAQVPGQKGNPGRGGVFGRGPNERNEGGSTRSEAPGTPGRLRCDFCGEPVRAVRRVALDAGYERLRTPHRELYACSDCSDKKEQALQYIKWFATPEVQKKWWSLGGFSCHTAVLNDPKFPDTAPFAADLSFMP